MTRLLRVIIMCFAMASAIGCEVAPNTLSPTRAHERGVHFLVETQNSDGSWGTFESARPGEIYLDNLSSHRAFKQATSALCLLALQKPAHTDTNAAAALDKGLHYVLNERFAGRASGSTFYDTWAHTYLVQALSRLHEDVRLADRRSQIRELLERELQLLHERQSADGGWAYYDFGYAAATPTGNMSTSFNTAAALVAMHEASAAHCNVNLQIIHDALACLERLRLPSGAYVYGTYAQLNPAAGYNKVKGSLGRSQSCNLALWLYKRDISQQQLLEGLANLRNEHHFIEIGKGRPYPHEAWYSTAGYYFMFGHYYAARIIRELEDPAQREDYRQWMLSTMTRLQDPDGSWFDFPLYGYHKAYGTAFGLLALQACDAVEELPAQLQVADGRN